MNSQQFYQYIEHPEKLGIHEEVQLRGVIKEYPYFQSAHLLLTKALKNMDNYTFEKQLRTAAIYSSNRAVLYQLLKTKSASTIGFPITEPKIETAPIEIAVVQKDEPKIYTPKSSELLDETIINKPMSKVEETPHNADLLSDPEDIYIQPIPLNAEAEEAPETSSAIDSNEAVTLPDIPKAAEEMQEAQIAAHSNTLNADIEFASNIDGVESVKEYPSPEVSSENIDLAPTKAYDPQDTIVEEDDDLLKSQREAIAKKYQEFLERKKAQEEGRPSILQKEEPTEKIATVIALPPIPIEEPIEAASERIEDSIQIPHLEETKIELPLIDSKVMHAATTESESKPSASIQHSFSDWLSVGNYEEVNDDMIRNDAFKKTSAELNILTDDILEKFINLNPTISRPKAEFFNPLRAAQRSLEETDDLATETLARLYEKQGSFVKAIQMYEKLSLKYPDKSKIFAARIIDIKNKIN